MLEHVISGLTKAGWVILPLILVSVIGWALGFHRMLALWGLSWRDRDGWRKSLAEGRWREFLERKPARGREGGPDRVLREVYRAGLPGRGRGAPNRETMEAKLDELMKFMIPDLEKSLSTLAILASAAPLMGLLGTVSGMVRTFQVISAFGTGNQALMSDSIAESLMATQNGLLVAFPLMLMHVYLTSKAEALEKETLAAAQGVINMSAASRQGAAPGTGVPERIFA